MKAFVYTMSSAPALSCGSTTEAAGQRSCLYRKELIRVGQYVKASEDLNFSVTLQDLKHWALSFQKMKANGVRVPIPSEHTDDATKNQGWVDDIFVEGDSLYGVMQLIGDESIALAGKVDVSIYVPQNFVDGKGVEYVRPITHVALCTNPVIPDLGDWEALALSFKQEPKKMDFTKIKKGLGITDEVTEDNISDLVLSHCTSLKDAAEKQQKDLQARIDAMESQEKPSPVVLRLSLDNHRMKLDQLVTAGRLSPAARKKAEEVFCTDAALSLSLTQDPQSTIFEGVLAILAVNEPQPLGEDSGNQTLRLDHSTMKDTDKTALVDEMKSRSA